jgi:hypothetical protein
VLGSTLGAMGGDAWKRDVGNLVFDEPQSPLGNAAGIAKEGAFNLATAGAAKVGTTLLDRGRVVNFGPSEQQAALETQKAVKAKFGIDLNLAQASGDPRIIQMWRFIANYPGKSASIANIANDLQAGQVDSAVMKLIAETGQGYPSAVLGKEAIKASQATVAAARKELQDEVRPLYEAAYAATPVVNGVNKQQREILEFLKLPAFRSAFAKGQELRGTETGAAMGQRTRTVETLRNQNPADGTWNKATTVVESTPTNAKRITSRTEEGLAKDTPDGRYTRVDSRTDVDIAQPSLQELDYTKRALDMMIADLKSQGKVNQARILETQRKAFVDKLDALPGSEWKAAREAYAAGMKSKVEPLEKGVVGFLANIKDEKAATVAAKMFTDPNVTGREILQAKGAILAQPGGKEAWDGLTRQWLAQAWNRANKITQAGEPRNAAGKFAQTVAGTADDRAKLVAALGQDRGQLAMDLVDALRQVAATSGTNSDTAFMQEINRAFRGPFSQTMKAVTTPRAAAIEGAERRAIERTTERIAEAMTDPKKVAQLRVVVKMPPGTKQVALLTSLLGLNAGGAMAGDVTSVDQGPPSYTPQ